MSNEEMKIGFFNVGHALIATQSRVCLNVETSRRLLFIEISLRIVFAVLAFVSRSIRVLFSQ